MISEKLLEDILVKYPELIEENLKFIGRQVTYHRKRIDILFEDKFKEKLIIELKIGNLQRDALSQVLEYEGYVLSEKDPSTRVMVIANRIPLNLKKAMDHHGIEYKEITRKRLLEFLEKRDELLFKEILDQNQDDSQTIAGKIKGIQMDNKGKEVKRNNYFRDGIIDAEANPFIRNDWIIQGFPLTQHRQAQLAELFGKNIETISNIKPINNGRYVAFVAVRWGFASVNNGILTQTEKWANRSNYDNYGQSNG